MAHGVYVYATASEPSHIWLTVHHVQVGRHATLRTKKKSDKEAEVRSFLASREFHRCHFEFGCQPQLQLAG